MKKKANKKTTKIQKPKKKTTEEELSKSLNLNYLKKINMM